MSTMIDDREGYNPPRPKKGNWATFRRTIKCAGEAGIACNRPGTLKSGRLWLCAYHAPRGSEG